MGAPPQNRKRKTQNTDTEKLIEIPAEEINDGKAKSKKAKKMKNVETPDVVIKNPLNENNKKAKKNKSLEFSIETVNDNEMSGDEEVKNDVSITKAKKNKKNKSPVKPGGDVTENEAGKDKKAKKHKLTEASAEEVGENDASPTKTKKVKKNKAKADSEELNASKDGQKEAKALTKDLPEEIVAKYPLLKDEALISRFMAVPMKTQHKARMRPSLIKKIKDTPHSSLADAIHTHMQTMLESNLSGHDLRRMRLLYNMLKAELGLARHTDKEPKVNGVAQLKSPPLPDDLPDDVISRYPVLKDAVLYTKFMAVTLNNNQKGRIRQHLKESLKGTSDTLEADAIHAYIQKTLKTEELTQSDLRKLRILYNMLRRSLQIEPTPKTQKNKVQKSEKVKKSVKDNVESEKGEGNSEQKIKGPKRYVAFVGNLPLDISEEKLMEHFSELRDKLKSVRIPKQPEGRKSAIAFLEVSDDTSFELLLSRHHSMMDNKRINVTYTTQQNSKHTKTEAKGKAAKLIAMQKSGKLAGSLPLSKKRNARRNKMKAAQKEAEKGE